MTKLFRFKEWIKYQITADNAYNLHSPFLYQFWENIIQSAKKDTLYSTKIAPILHSLYTNKTHLKKTDLGTGKNTGTEQVSYIAKTSSVRPKYGHILHQLVKYLKPKTIVELGTCFGISTRYMLEDFEGTHFYSIEGSPARHNVAKSYLDTLQKPNLILMQSSFEEALSVILSKHSDLDLIFIDGNHSFEATIQYFNLLLPNLHNNSILIFDDIHWSEGMLTAWKEICNHNRISLTVDLFQFGICFFNSDLSKENKILRY
jgi:predicted O-methyltransferase YrrM